MFERLRQWLSGLRTSILVRLIRSASKEVEAGYAVPAPLHQALLALVLRSSTQHAPAKISNEQLGQLRGLLVSHLPQEARVLIPSLEIRAAPVMSTWAYQNHAMTWDIADSDLVLDIGSGGWPFQRADHLADKYVDATTHRTEHLQRDSRPFFQVDLQHLPFRNNAYDFVFCSHVLEHLDSPGDAIRELMRVGRKGYIEVPTRLSDVMLNFTRIPNHHRWHGLVLGETLVLTEWNDNERRELGNHYFESLQTPYLNEFQGFFERNRDIFFASLSWDEVIKFLVIDKHGHVIDSSTE